MDRKRKGVGVGAGRDGVDVCLFILVLYSFFMYISTVFVHVSFIFQQCFYILLFLKPRILLCYSLKHVDDLLLFAIFQSSRKVSLFVS